MQTIRDWLHASPLPRKEARMLLQAATGYSHSQIITQDTTLLTKNIHQQLTSWQQRRINGEPMAYILGEKEFYGRTFKVSSAVLIPRPETEHLVEIALQKLPENGHLWDLGTGSGAIAITIKCEAPQAHVFASDISSTALSVAQQNATLLKANIHFAQGSWFNINNSHQKWPSQFDVLVSNPPYIEANDPHLQQNGLPFEPQHALTDFADGLQCIRQLAQNAHHHLKPNGWLIIEHGYNQGEATRKILQENGFHQVHTLCDLANLERITLGCQHQ